MKTFKCPLCGKEMQLQSDVYDEDLYTGNYTRMYYYECINCPLATTPADSAQEAENQIKDLISRFPPIMRVWPGDKVKLFGDRRVRKVIGKNANRGILYLETASGPPEPVRHDDVILWPWEIEQKGGQQ